jgi:FlaA1/EpsC-like NDP-sugar epimerase
MPDFFRDQVVMITGACGSVGQELVVQLLGLLPAEVRLFDNNESGLFIMHQQLSSQYPQVHAFLGDVRDAQKVATVARGCDVILHCAAFKHVFFSEYNPFEAVQTNILGVKNVIEAAIRHNVKLVIFTSSDKAVNPTSVMGTSKLMGERLITAANVVRANSTQRFSSVRFGNVLGSRGSVFEVFAQQIKQGGPVTVTDPNMTRFIMSLNRAAHLVLESAGLACGGEVMVTKMEAIRIPDLARVMIDLLAPAYGHDPGAIEISIIGAKPGEKTYEELVSQEETGRGVELPELYVVLPAFRAIYHEIDYQYLGAATGHPLTQPYNSAQTEPLNPEQLRQFILEHRLLPPEVLLRFPDLKVRPCAS